MKTGKHINKTMNVLINKLNRTWSISHVDQTVLIAFTRHPTKAQTQFIQAYEYYPRHFSLATQFK